MKHTLRNVTVLSLALLVGCFLFAPPAAQAQINYQGRLTDAVGAPLADGQYPIEFSLWTAATGGAAPVWGPYILDGGVATGHGPLADLVGSRFNVIIGNLDTTSRSLTTGMAASTTVYLEIKVGSDAPISPRQIILAAPRALSADVIPHVTPNVSGADIIGNLGVSGDATIAGNAAVTGNATVSGNVGIGNPTPSAKLDVNGNAIVSGNVGIGAVAPTAKLDVDGNVRGRALLRSGSETGTSQPPSPAGLVIRRINSTSSTAGQIIARTDLLTLERDGSVSGLLIRFPANVNKQTVMVKYMNNDNNRYTYFAKLDSSVLGAAAGTFALATAFPGNVIDWEITFGDMTYSGAGHYSQVHLTRYDVAGAGASNWIGTLTSTFNQ